MWSDIILLQVDLLKQEKHDLYHYFIPKIIKVIFVPLRLDIERLFCYIADLC